MTSSTSTLEVFSYLQTKIDSETEVRDGLKTILTELEKRGREAAAILARAHATSAKDYGSIAAQAQSSIDEQIRIIAELKVKASQYPYYKYNSLWSRDIQNTVFYILFCGWLGGYDQGQGQLLTIDQVGEVLGVPVNLKEEDAFHLTIEEYLQSLITLVDELSRMAINAVTQSDYEVALQISILIKEIHAGFSILNLKNDSLRRRSDSIKYSVKKVEDVVYDLSLRNLIPKKP